MDRDQAELASAATTLEDLTARITATAERLLAAGDEAAAADLFDVERALRNASRRLSGVVRRNR